MFVKNPGKQGVILILSRVKDKNAWALYLATVMLLYIIYTNKRNLVLYHLILSPLKLDEKSLRISSFGGKTQQNKSCAGAKICKCPCNKSIKHYSVMNWISIRMAMWIDRGCRSEVTLILWDAPELQGTALTLRMEINSATAYDGYSRSRWEQELCIHRRGNLRTKRSAITLNSKQQSNRHSD